MMSIVDDASSFVPVEQSAGQRWYANLPLAEDGDETDVAVSFQNGALEEPMSIKWKPYNLLDHNGATITIRKGDALRITCIDPARAFDDLEHARGGQFRLNVSGTQYSSANTCPIAVVFNQAGTINVNGTYFKGNNSISAAINVIVVDGSFPEESPACLVGQERQWSFEGMPSNIVYEVDDSIEFAVKSSSLTTNNQQLTTIALTAQEANGEHVMVARTGEGGPILGSAQLNPFWIQNAADGYFWTVEWYEDSQLWEVESIQQNLPDDVEVEIKVVVGGVTLDDYTLERWVTNSDYDETGVYPFRLFHPDDEAASVCHTFMVYQDGRCIGEVLGGEDEF